MQNRLRARICVIAVALTLLGLITGCGNKLSGDAGTTPTGAAGVSGTPITGAEKEPDPAVTQAVPADVSFDWSEDELLFADFLLYFVDCGAAETDEWTDAGLCQ